MAENANVFDAVIIGGGPAGVSAAIYSARKALKTALLEGKLIGGETASSGEIENYAGIESIKGPELAEKLESHLRKFVSDVISETAVSVSKKDGIFEIQTEEGKRISGRSVIIATGAKYRELGIPGEKKFRGKGVSYCTACDAPFFRGKTVVVVGGGNTGVDAAILLSKIAKKTYLMHRREELRAEEILQKRLDKGGVEKILGVEPLEISENGNAKKITYKVLKTGETKSIDVEGIFIHVGTVPSSELAKMLGVETDVNGYVKTDGKKRTNVEGVFAAGDITGTLQQIVVAAGEGAIAATSAYDYLKSRKE